jgi:N-acetylmuramoyl-L-alanine amidase
MDNRSVKHYAPGTAFLSAGVAALRKAVCAALAVATLSAAAPAERRAPGANGEYLSDARNSRAVLVIDAGHGGEDGGAVSYTGAVESEINLAIARKLYLLTGFFGVSAVMTRDSEHIEYSDSAATTREKKREDMRNRIAVTRATPGAVLLSIHQNKFDDARPSGAQVIYAPDGDSEALAVVLQEFLLRYTPKGNRNGAVRDTGQIYLLNNAGCPAVLVECGFLSNPADELRLRSDGYRTLLAAVLLSGFRTYTAIEN